MVSRWRPWFYCGAFSFLRCFEGWSWGVREVAALYSVGGEFSCVALNGGGVFFALKLQGVDAYPLESCIQYRLPDFLHMKPWLWCWNVWKECRHLRVKCRIGNLAPCPKCWRTSALEMQLWNDTRIFLLLSDIDFWYLQLDLPLITLVVSNIGLRYTVVHLWVLKWNVLANSEQRSVSTKLHKKPIMTENFLSPNSGFCRIINWKPYWISECPTIWLLNSCRRTAYFKYRLLQNFRSK
jgi:hypothetical protein